MGPGRRRLGVTPPLHGEFEFGVAPEAAGALVEPAGRLGQPLINARRRTLFVGPGDQARPTPHQAFVRQVDDRTRAERHWRRRRQETASLAPEHLDHVEHLSFGHTRHGREPFDTRRPPHAARIRHRVGQRLEQMLDEPAATVGDRFLVGLFGVPGQGVANRANRVIVLDINRRLWVGAAAGALPVFEGAHQRMLGERQLIGIVAKIVEDTVDEPGRNRGASHRHGTGDGEAERIARHAPHQVHARIHGVGQTRKVHAIADEVGPQREHDVDRDVLLASGLDKQPGKRDRFVVRVGVAATAEAEQFLELVNHHEHVVVARHPRLADGVGQPPGAAPQRGLDQDAIGLGKIHLLAWAVAARIDAEDVWSTQTRRQVAYRIGAGPQDGDAPRRARAGHVATLERGNESRPDERRLAAA